MPKAQPSKVPSGGVSGHTLDRFWENQLKGGNLKVILKARAAEIGKLTRSRGQELAQQVREGKAPVWVQNLGPVPTRKRTFRKWARVAGEVDAMRKKYNVPDSHPEPLPRELVREAGQRVNNARLAAEGAPVSAVSKVRTRAAESVLGVAEQLKRVSKSARLSQRAGEQSQSPAPEATAEPQQQQAPTPQQSPTSEAVTDEAAQPEPRKEKPVSDTEKRLDNERAARAEKIRQMMERTQNLDDKLRNNAPKQGQQTRNNQQRLERERRVQQLHEQARRGVRGPGLG